MASNYDSQFTYENDDHALPDLFGEFVPATESIDEDDYVDDAIIEEPEDDEESKIFEEGQFDQYAQYCDISAARADVAEESIDSIFDFDFFVDVSPATESLEDDLEELGDMDGTNEEGEEPDETEDASTDDDGDEEPEEGGEDETPDDLAAATDEQLEEDNQSPEDEMSEESTDDDTEGTDDITTDNTTDSDPLKSVETKTAYRDKFILLYRSITDSVSVMEDFTPEYNSEASRIYYKCKQDFNTLRDQIYKICVKRMNHITVDEVLRQYTICNLTYDSILKDMHTFSDEYKKELKAVEAKEHRKSSKPRKTEEK